MSKGFYRAFEDKLRGSRQLVKSRLSVYLPFINLVKDLYPGAQAVDLGCGRGEWLELLGENGIVARGVDLDDEMLQACRDIGLDVATADALSFLKSVPDESLFLVSGFHLVEHIPFEALQDLVIESLRVLKPGGLLILETPNPENLVVGTSNFYLDPTHICPIPPALLSFVPEYYGFGRVKTVRLQESVALINNADISLLDVLQGVSPDYSIVAQKDAGAEVMTATAEPFDKDYGLTLHNLATLYDRKQKNQIDEVKKELASIYESWSWRLFAPIRFLGRAFSNEKTPIQRMKSAAWKVLAPVLRWVKSVLVFVVIRCPPLRRLAKQAVARFPIIMRFIRRIERSGINYAAMTPSREGPELFIDVTHVFTEDLRTGIQRVVRSISTEIEQEFLPGIKVEPIYLTDAGGYWHYRYVNGFADDFEIVVPKKGDIFLGLDLNARIVGAVQTGLFQDWIARGTKISFVVYDILPIEHPEWWPGDVGRHHEEWLRSVLNVSDNLICISRAVCDSVRAWALSAGYEQSKIPVMKSFHLGADVENSLPTRGMPGNGEAVLAVLKGSPSFLMVGTVEPRKGHSLVLSAFEKLWLNGVDVKFVIVGKQGWLVEELSTKLRNHPEYGRNLFWLEHASDEYLDKLYDAACCLIAASEGEGFGLPLIEAAQHKLPIIARDIPVFREVAGEHGYYFSGSDSDNFAGAITDWLELYENNKHPLSVGMPWLTWKESAQQLRSIIGASVGDAV
ncbi:glycosyltransferase [Pseudomonas sp. GM18]|uniref:glycosyltransferase n=1 Tax=Pseudomonas sp. GM18 TaxID=1144324 RepID=UPI0002725B27|nr:glycosyltransferase [Pseudomonas sp. GM18]EJM14026.1 glycosyltransferase [Pseudomonas sp. GM18]